MALSHTFFGLRKGSTKTHTYTVGKNMAKHTEEINGSYQGGSGGNYQITKERTSRQGRETTTLNSYKTNAAVYTLAGLWGGFERQIRALQKQSLYIGMASEIQRNSEKHRYNQFISLNTVRMPVDVYSYPLQSKGLIGIGNYRLCGGEANPTNVTCDKSQYIWPLAYLAYQLMPEGGKLTELSSKLIEQGYYKEGDTFALYLVSLEGDSKTKSFTMHYDTAYFVVDTKTNPDYKDTQYTGRITTFDKNVMQAIVPSGILEINKLAKFGEIHRGEETLPIVMAAAVTSHEAHVTETIFVPNRGVSPQVTLQESYDDYMGRNTSTGDKYLDGGETIEGGWKTVEFN